MEDSRRWENKFSSTAILVREITSKKQPKNILCTWIFLWKKNKIDQIFLTAETKNEQPEVADNQIKAIKSQIQDPPTFWWINFRTSVVSAAFVTTKEQA